MGSEGEWRKQAETEGNEPVSPEDILVVWCAIIHLKLIFMRKKLIYEREGETQRESVCLCMSVCFCIEKWSYFLSITAWIGL